jgi:hypothetical protein
MSAVAPLSSIQYVYDFAALERLPEGPTSVKVAARRLLSGPSLTTGKSSTVGAVLSGSHIISTLGTQAQGSGAKAQKCRVPRNPASLSLPKVFLSLYLDSFPI